MSSDKPLPSNSLEYYRAAADYDGVVLKASEALSGLSTEDLIRWYLARCTDFYWGISLRDTTKGRSWSEKSKSIKTLKLASRMASRLYVLRVIRKTEQVLRCSFSTEIKWLESNYEASYARAIDKALCLTHHLKVRAMSVLCDEALHKNARLGRRLLLKKYFDSEYDGYNMHQEFGEIMADAQHFRHLLTSFKQHTQPVANPKQKEKIAVLYPGITVEQVQHLLADVGMGTTYAKSGEWAVAFRALLLSGIMSGIAPEMHRWAVLHTSVTKAMGQTFKNAWGDEVDEAHLSHNPSQRAVFRAVLAKSRKLLLSSN